MVEYKEAALTDKQFKIQKQIDKSEAYLKTFHGNTSSVKMKKYAIQQKINALKESIFLSK
jgi:hypothetical protein